MSSVYICDGHCLYCVNWHFKVGHNHVGSFHSPKADIIHVVFSYSHIANVIVCYVYMNATKVFGVGYVSLITQSEPVCVKCMGPCWTNTYQWVQLDFYIYVHAYNLATTQLRGNEKEISYWWCNQVTALPHQNGFSSYQISHWVHRHMQNAKIQMLTYTGCRNQGWNETGKLPSLKSGSGTPKTETTNRQELVSWFLLICSSCINLCSTSHCKPPNHVPSAPCRWQWPPIGGDAMCAFVR